MRSIRKKNTKPELAVRRAVHSLGYRFSLRSERLPGSPDIVLTRHRKVIFVHGCFWHQHQGCRSGRPPRIRVEYWGPKLTRNMARDAAALADLKELGWDALVIWACELTDEDAMRNRLKAFIQQL